MLEPVKIPAMGESISSGVLASWHVANGAIVQEGEVLFELETDKITSEGYAEASGRIELQAESGSEVQVGQQVAHIDTSVEAPQASQAPSSAEASTMASPEISSGAPTHEPASPDASHAAEPLGAENAPLETPLAQADQASQANQAAPLPQASLSAESLKNQSPAVRRLALETGIDPSTLPHPSGKKGRASKADMLAAIAASKASAGGASTSTSTSAANTPLPAAAKAIPSGAPSSNLPSGAPASTPKASSAPSPAASPSAHGSSSAGLASSDSARSTRRKMTPLRRRIAERLVAAANQTALLTTFNECDMSAVIQLRKTYQEAFVARHGVKLGFMSFFVKAVVDALKAVPQVNTELDADVIVQHHYYDMGIAVGTERGLVVPVLRDPDKKNLAEIEKDILALAVAAREGKLRLEDLQGGVFTISNGGIYGSMLSTPLLNMPQSAILGLHNIVERPVVHEGAIVARPIMYLALSYDHRLIDGKEAVGFLLKIKESIEAPEQLLLEL